jgi:glycosyltransferase involved in cell wall biosynthesis
MKILYLYAEVMGYTMATIRALVKGGAEVHIIHWDHKKLTPYHAPQLAGVYLYKRSELTIAAMQRLVKEIDPAITVVSGWMDKGYLAIAKELRTQGCVVVTGIDAQWSGLPKQKIAALLGGVGYFSQYFSHAWVTGSYQFEYARRLGFDKQKIIYDLYSADLDLFHQSYLDHAEQKNIKYPHRFLFVGRLERIKGLDILLQAWKLLGEEKLDWELHLIGNGSLKPMLECETGVVIKDFMQPDRLMQEVAHAGCFILPSSAEPWGVVVHEFAGAGLPLLLSNIVGAASTFLISGLNGFNFEANSSQALANRMAQMISLTDQQLLSMSNYSYCLSQRITPESSAANLLSVSAT